MKSRRQDNVIRRQHLRDRTSPATKTAAATVGTHGRPISPQTVINRLREHIIRRRRPYVGPVLTVRHRHARQEWCQENRNWTRAQWGSVIFSDESSFTLQMADGRTRRPGERYNDDCVMVVNRFHRGVMVWGAITANEKLELVTIHGNMNARRYIDDVLDNVVVPYI